MFQNQKWTNCFLMIVGAIFMSLAFFSPAGAANCGGNIPCNCGDTLTANRTLVSGVDSITKLGTPCSGDGLIIATAGLTLDLNRNQITGSGVGVGILIDGVNNVTIKNGGVDRFGVGIDGQTNDSFIITVRPNANGIGTQLGDGIFLQGNGNELIGILAKRNGNNGVTVIGDDNLLQGHNDEYNGFHGMHVVGDGNVLFGNLASENRKTGPGNGITVDGHNNTLEQNKVTKQNTNGIVVTGNINTLIKNQVVKQDRDGIIVVGDDNVLTDSKATGSKGVGIIVTGAGNPLDSHGNVVSQNRTKPQCSIYGVTTPDTCIQR